MKRHVFFALLHRYRMKLFMTKKYCTMTEKKRMAL